MVDAAVLGRIKGRSLRSLEPLTRPARDGVLRGSGRGACPMMQFDEPAARRTQGWDWIGAYGRTLGRPLKVVNRRACWLRSANRFWRDARVSVSNVDAERRKVIEALTHVESWRSFATN